MRGGPSGRQSETGINDGASNAGDDLGPDALTEVIEKASEGEYRRRQGVLGGRRREHERAGFRVRLFVPGPSGERGCGNGVHMLVPEVWHECEMT